MFAGNSEDAPPVRLGNQASSGFSMTYRVHSVGRLIKRELIQIV